MAPMDRDEREWAVVTGASAGIGRALAHEFAAGGFDVAVVARREERLRDLAGSLREDHGVETEVVVMDLADPEAARQLDATLRARELTVDALVNNVGRGVYGPLVDTDPDDEVDQVRLNVELPLRLTKRLLPPMVERDRGRVLTVASMAAFLPGARMAGYYASKAYALRLSEALSVELADTGVAATALCPGPVDTEFQDRADMRDSRIGSTFSAAPAAVAAAGYRGAMDGEAVVVPGLTNKLLYLGARLAPRGVLRRVGGWVNSDR
jgi:short-subunit dehydrogenase